MSLAKDKYREETNNDCYCGGCCTPDGEYANAYVHWLEKQVNTLILPVVSKRYLIEVYATKGNRLHEAIINEPHQAECVYKQAKEDYKGYLVTKIEIPNVY